MSYLQKNAGRCFGASLAAGVLIFLAGSWWLAAHDSKTIFLEHHAPAKWILFPKPPEGLLHLPADVRTEFRRSFVVEKPMQKAALFIRALRSWVIVINGNELVPTAPAGDNWKEAREMDVSQFLRSGTNELRVIVSNTNGPNALWLALSSGKFQLVSDEGWEASMMDSAWRSVRLADNPPVLRPGSELYGGERPLPSFLSHLPALLVFAVFSAGLWVRGRAWMEKYAERGEPWGPVTSGRFAGVVFGLVAVLWTVLYLNNSRFLPYCMGFDSNKHLAYINYIKTRWQLPLATDGWQMYQPPLYYMATAVLLAPFRGDGFGESSIVMLRVLGLGMGLITIGLVYLSLRLLFPRRIGPQLAGLALAAFLPENLYLFHYITNETPSAMFITAAVYFCLRIVKQDSDPAWLYLALGLCLGAALLSKVTGVIAVPFIIVALLGRWFQQRPAAFGMQISKMLLAAGAALIVCGWHYARVWRHLGSPLVGNWDAASGYHWWMEDGFNTAGHIFRFGSCFVYPWHSGFVSFFDGLYSTLWGDGLFGGMVSVADRPAWNYGLMAAGYILALIPSLLLLAGLARAIRRVIRRPDPTWFLLVGFGLTTFAAILWMSLKLPSCGQIKSFYGLIAMTPICAFAALGWEWLQDRRNVAIGITVSLLGTWAITSYATYWISGWHAETHLSMGGVWARDGQVARAAIDFAAAYRIDPGNLKLKKILAVEALQKGNVADCKAVVDTVLQKSPDDAEARSLLAAIYLLQQLPDAAIAEARRSVALAPGQPLAHQRLYEVFMALGRFSEAAAAAKEGLAAAPLNPEMQLNAGLAFAKAGDVASAGLYLRHSAALRPQPPDLLNRLAWIFSTDSEPQLRDGVRALELAKRACDGENAVNPRFLGTLAAAQAETGNYQEAIVTASRALELAQAAFDSAVAGALQNQLELYRSGKPFHQAAAKPASSPK